MHRLRGWRVWGPAAALLWAISGAAAAPAAGPPGHSVYLEDLTWPELRERIAGGATTALIPLGGTEQNGPHMVLGKHNVRVRVLAGRIAEGLGDALVAPVLAYVPEGAIDPPTQHMRWPGTISIPEPVFEATLQAAARSLRKHGFCQVVFLGDHGGYLASVARVAAALNRAGAAHSNCRAHALPEFYRAAQTEYPATLKARGFSAEEIGTHAGLADTALTLAVEPTLVRMDATARPQGAGPGGTRNDGVAGDPRRATAELGRPGIEHIIQASVVAIRTRIRAAP